KSYWTAFWRATDNPVPSENLPRRQPYQEAIVQKGFKRILLVGSLMAALFASTGASAQAQPPIKLGVLLSTSGVGASTGLGILEGVKLAVEEINAAGGIKGRKVEILLRDTQVKPDVATAVAKELLTKEGVKILIGPATSGEA